MCLSTTSIVFPFLVKLSMSKVRNSLLLKTNLTVTRSFVYFPTTKPLALCNSTSLNLSGKRKQSQWLWDWEVSWGPCWSSQASTLSVEEWVSSATKPRDQRIFTTRIRITAWSSRRCMSRDISSQSVNTGSSYTYLVEKRIKTIFYPAVKGNLDR